MNILQTFLKSLFFFFEKKKKRFYKLPGNLFTNYCKLYGNLFFFFLKKKKRFYKLPRNLFTKKVLKKFKLALELPWRLFFWKLQKKKRFYKLPVNLFTNYCKLSGNLFFFFDKKKKEILQTSRKPLYKKGFKKVQVRTGAALAFILLETETIYWKTYSSIQQQRYFSTMKTLFLWAK